MKTGKLFAATLLLVASLLTPPAEAIGGCFYELLTICYRSCWPDINLCNNFPDQEEACKRAHECGQLCNSAYCWGNGYLPPV